MKKPLDEKLWKFDLPHIGALCELILDKRDITRTAVADYLKIDWQRLDKFQRKGYLGLSDFERLVNAFESPDLMNREYLTPEKAGFLFGLYKPSKNRKRMQRELQSVDLQIIHPDNHPPKDLVNLVSLLQEENFPAFIMDACWFIHAFNEPVIRLFGIDQDLKYLNQWEAWHVMATKFLPTSLVRKAHRELHRYFPPSVEQFFRDRRTFRYLFTIQMRLLIRELDKLSEPSDFDFTRMWLQAITFLMTYEPNQLRRTILFEDKEIQMEAYQRVTLPIQVTPGNFVDYTIVSWNPKDEPAEHVFRKIRNLSGRKSNLLYAAEYDVKGNFHVNNWPEALEYLEGW